MKVYIQTDIEGTAGFVFFENRADQTVENFEHRQRMRRLFTAEVDAAVRAAYAAGATEVVINDSHGSGYNIIFEDLDPRCEIIHGRNCSGPHWLPELDGSFDALMLVGVHAMGGTPNAILSHSRWEVNGGDVYLSEGSMAAAIAGTYGVPTVFVSGDDKVCAEISEKIPGIAAAVVKKGLGAYVARSRMPARAREMIAAGVGDGLRRRAAIAPYVIPGPLKLNLLDNSSHAPPFKGILDEPVEADDMAQAFWAFESQMPWIAFHTEVPDGFTYP